MCLQDSSTQIFHFTTVTQHSITRTGQYTRERVPVYAQYKPKAENCHGKHKSKFFVKMSTTIADVKHNNESTEVQTLLTTLQIKST